MQESGAFVTVDVDVTDMSSGTIKDMRVYVEVLVSKTYMALTPSLFKGVKGNRRDNIVRQIDKLLNGSLRLWHRPSGRHQYPHRHHRQQVLRQAHHLHGVRLRQKPEPPAMIDNTVLISGAPMRFGGILFRQPTLEQIYRDPDVGRAVYDSYLYLVSLTWKGFSRPRD